MSKGAISTLSVQSVNNDGLSLAAIANSPRLYTPYDIQLACENTNIICTGENIPSVSKTINFIFFEFFALAHRTGLYNRQKHLWESLTKISSISVYNVKASIFTKETLPLYDLRFQGYRDQTLIAIHLIDPSYQESKIKIESHLKKFLNRTRNLHDLAGLFFISPVAYNQSVHRLMKKLTHGDDPVGRFESKLPKPWSCPLNLLLLETLPARGSDFNIQLVHPDLTAMKRIRASVVEDE